MTVYHDLLSGEQCYSSIAIRSSYHCVRFEPFHQSTTIIVLKCEDSMLSLRTDTVNASRFQCRKDQRNMKHPAITCAS